MLGSDPCISASWALSASAAQAALPQPSAPPRGDKAKPWTDHRGSNPFPAHHSRRAAHPVGRSTPAAQNGIQSGSNVTDPAPSVQQPDPVGRLNSGSPSGTDEQLRSLIADAMRQLPFEHRAVIYRAYYQGWTTARIADDLKITEAAVKSRLHNGLHALRLIFRCCTGQLNGRALHVYCYRYCS